MKAIVFAAGLGTRLKPFTEHHPKALVEINGIPMLARAIKRLTNCGITDIVVNVHHFANQIISYLEANDNFGANIYISDESDLLLDTGGGIRKAAGFLSGSEPFVACNADILTDLPLKEMICFHNESGADVTLLTKHRETSRYLYFKEDGYRLAGWINKKNGDSRPAGFVPQNDMLELAFGGYHIISQKALGLLCEQPEEVPFGIIPWYLENIENIDIKAYCPAYQYQWFDIGSPETLSGAKELFIE